MKVTDETWEQAMAALNQRRATEEIKNSVKGVDDYAAHLSKIKIGKSVLDVGAYDGKLKNLLPEDVIYYGIDPFPKNDSIHKTTIEEFGCHERAFDTVVMFASLDNVKDFKMAIEKIKHIADKNVLFLTGFNIEPDRYHTIKITEAMLIDEMKPFKVSYLHYFHPKIALIAFTR